MTTATSFPLDDTTLDLLLGVSQAGPVSMVHRSDGLVSRPPRMPDAQRELGERLELLGVGEWTQQTVVEALVLEVKRLRAERSGS